MYFKDFLDKNSKTLIMGILNITPDSFYDGNKYFDSDLNEKIKNHFQLRLAAVNEPKTEVKLR